MKTSKILLFVAVICSTSSMYAQSKKELQAQLQQLQQQNQQLQQQMQQNQQMMMMMMQNQQNNNQGYNQQYNQGYNQQQTQQGMYPQQQMQQQVANSPDGFSPELQKSRIESLQFANSQALRAVGYGIDEEESFARDLAEENARAQMARNIETFTKDAIDRYRKKSNYNGSKGRIANDENLSTTVARQIETGCIVIDEAKYYNSTTGEYKYEILVEYNKARVMGLIESQDQEIKRNRATFEAEMQKVFDEYQMENEGTTTALKKQALIDAQEEAKQDRQAARDAQAKQQDADNAFRAQQSEQQYNLNSQKQAQDASIKKQQLKNDSQSNTNLIIIP